MDMGTWAKQLREKLAAADAADAAAAQAKKAEPYERLWGQNTPPPAVQDMDAGTAWWDQSESNGLISRNMAPVQATPGRGVGRMPSTIIQG